MKKTKTIVPISMSQTINVKKTAKFNDRVATGLLSPNPSTGPATVDGIERIIMGIQRDKNVIYIGQSCDGIDITRRHLTGADMRTLETVGTMCVRWAQEGITPPWSVSVDNLWRAENGLSGTERRPTKKQKDALIQRFRKLSSTKVMIDCSRETPLKGGYDWTNPAIPPEYRTRLDGGLIDVAHIEGFYGEVKNARGRLVPAFVIRATPILYCYILSRRHALLYDSSLLTVTSAGMEIHENTLPIRRYLIGEISRMYRVGLPGYRSSRRILYQTMYKDGGILTPEERTIGKTYKTPESEKNWIEEMTIKDRQEVRMACDEWISRGWIDGMKEIKDVATTKRVGIEIELNPANFEN